MGAWSGLSNETVATGLTVFPHRLPYIPAATSATTPAFGILLGLRRGLLLVVEEDPKDY